MVLWRNRASGLVLSAVVVGFLLAPVHAKQSDDIPFYPFGTPTFGLSDAPDGSLLVADAGSGIVELRKGEGALVAALPGVTDIAPIGRGVMYATTGGNPEGPNPPTARSLWRVSRGSTKLVADLGAFEATVNPDGGAIDSNPFDVALLNGGSVLVADAAANALLIVDEGGSVDWVATLPNELVSTANIKLLAHCTPGSMVGFCGLPPMMPAQPVTATVAVGPDGAYYIGELKGFPAPTGASKVWRVAPGTRHTRCPSTACSVVASGFTSIIDLAFGPDGKLYVVELDEHSWFAIEGPFGGAIGGTVNACQLGGSCSVVVGGVTMPIAVTFDKRGQLFLLKNALIPGAAQVSAIP